MEEPVNLLIVRYGFLVPGKGSEEVGAPGLPDAGTKFTQCSFVHLQ